MIDLAQSRGVDVLIATLTPVTDHRDADWPGLQTGINNLNARIRSIAAARGVTIVDLYAALQADLSLLQNDGLHPTAAGYRKIAETFLRALITLYESAPAPQPSANLAAPRRN
jgi:lysophospholipase L1-like esterase